VLLVGIFSRIAGPEPDVGEVGGSGDEAPGDDRVALLDSVRTETMSPLAAEARRKPSVPA
jgi:hypothetical protein